EGRYRSVPDGLEQRSQALRVDCQRRIHHQEAHSMPAHPGKDPARLHQSTEKEKIGVQLFRGHYTRQEETDALMEYSGLRRVFTDLTIHGKLPDEGPAALLEHGPGKDEFVISIIDDDESLRDSTRQLLRSAGY